MLLYFVLVPPFFVFLLLELPAQLPHPPNLQGNRVFCSVLCSSLPKFRLFSQPCPFPLKWARILCTATGIYLFTCQWGVFSEHPLRTWGPEVIKTFFFSLIEPLTAGKQTILKISWKAWTWKCISAMNYSFSFGLTGNSRWLKWNFKFSFLKLMFCSMKNETGLQLLCFFLSDECQSLTFSDFV